MSNTLTVSREEQQILANIATEQNKIRQIRAKEGLARLDRARKALDVDNTDSRNEFGKVCKSVGAMLSPPPKGVRRNKSTAPIPQ